MKRKITVCLALLMICAMFSGCNKIKEKLGIAFPSKEYVEATLEAVYHGDYEKYCACTGEAQMVAEDHRKKYIEGEADYMAEYLRIDTLSQEGEQRLYALIEKLYEQVRFEVQDPIDNNRNQLVEVVVYPVDFIGAAKEELEGAINDFNQALLAGEYDSLSEEEQKLKYEEKVLDVCEKYTQIEASQFQVSANLTITEEEGGYYRIQDGFQKLDELVIQY